MVEVTDSRKAAIDLLTKIEEYDHACDCDDCNSLRTHTLPFVTQAFTTYREAAAKAGRDAGIIEGLEMAAKVADAYEYGKGRPLSEGDIIPMEGAEQAASEIAVVIRALIEEQK